MKKLVKISDEIHELLWQFAKVEEKVKLEEAVNGLLESHPKLKRFKEKLKRMQFKK